MTARLQKQLAAGAVLLAVTFVLAANARLLFAAIGSQPPCVVTKAAPAKRAC